MSDQQETGGDTSLEEVFLSREFGRASSREISSSTRAEEPAKPAQLEEVFLSEAFGHPEAVTAATPKVAPVPLAVLAGGGEAAAGERERDTTRYRAIAAVSGVAAAALVVAGIAVGSGPSSKAPTQSAQGKPPGGSTTGPTGGAPGSAPTPAPASSGGAPAGASGTGTPASSFASGSGTGTGAAQLASETTPASPTVVVEVPPGTTVQVVTPAPPGGSGGSGGSGGTPPGTSTGGGSVLTPVLVVVGDTVATVGTTVTVASNGLGTALPPVSPVTGVLGSLGVTVTDLGKEVAGTTT